MTCPCGVVFDASRAAVARGRRACSPACGYRLRVRPSGLKYKITRPNPGWGKNLPPVRHGVTPPNFKGEACGYDALHDWVLRKKGPAQVCTHCGSGRNVQWANVSHEYRRDLNDYMALCVSCHRHYDNASPVKARDIFHVKDGRLADRRVV